MGITNMAATIPGFAVPALVGVLTHGVVSWNFAPKIDWNILNVSGGGNCEAISDGAEWVKKCCECIYDRKKNIFAAKRTYGVTKFRTFECIVISAQWYLVLITMMQELFLVTRFSIPIP
jgi:hypothetical protein